MLCRCGVPQAVEVAKSAIADIQQPPEQEAGPGGGEEEKKPEAEGEDDQRRKAALEKLEKASEDSILGQASLHLAALSPRSLVGKRCFWQCWL